MRIDLPGEFCAQTYHDLLSAAEHIEAVGWHQNSYFKPWEEGNDPAELGDVPCCAMGSVGYVVDFWELRPDGYGYQMRDVDHPWRREDSARRDRNAEAMVEHWLRYTTGRHTAVPTWNDDPDQTESGVINGLKAAARYCLDVQQSRVKWLRSEAEDA